MAIGTQPGDLDQLFSESNFHPPRRRRALTLSLVAVFVIVLAAIGFFVDGAARGVTEDTVEQEIADRLPDGAGPITATIGGFAFLPQLFSGTLDDLDVTFALDGQALPALAGETGSMSALRIEDGALNYDGSVEFLGVPLGYTVALEPSVDNGLLVLTPTAVEATTGAASIDLGQILDLGALAMRGCAASLLPQSMELTGVKVVGSRLQFAVTGHDVPINIAELRTRGSCG